MKPTQVFTGSSALGLLAVTGMFCVFGGGPENVVAAQDADVATPDVLEITGVVRDFIESSKAGGHSDFEKVPSKGYGIYNGNISPTIGSDIKPAFTGGGWLTKTQWTDIQNRPICYLLYNPSPPWKDVAGVMGAASTGAIESAESFAQWFNDVPGVNLSQAITLTLVKQPDGNYVFDDKLDPVYSSLGGFFPIDGKLFGNSGGSPNHNFHFTMELHTQFTYDAASNQVFKFIGDDDVWVFINGQLVIDLGGIHPAKTQFVDLNRLNLVDGQVYNLDFFFAERRRTQSNCRISTNIVLNSTAVPSITAAFD